MKVRKGFVSNSSSTSFCIYGAIVDENFEDKLYENKEKTFLNFFYGDPNSYPDRAVYLGLEYSSMSLDETKRQFQNKVEEEIKRLIPESTNFGTYEESYYG